MRIVRNPLPWLSLAVLACWTLAGAAAEKAANSAAETRNLAAEGRLRQDITFLASDECEGRGPTTQGLNKAANHIATEFKKAGLKPGSPDGSYFQPFTIPGAIQDAPATLVLKGPRGQHILLKQGVDFYPMGLGGAGKASDAPLVFAGYGISAEQQAYDDLAGLDVEDKVVVVLRDTPRSIPNQPNPLRQKAAFVAKLGQLEKLKAAAVLFVNDAETARTGDDLLDFNYTAVAGGAGKLPALHVKRWVLEALLNSQGGPALADLEKTIDRDFKPQSRDLKGWTAGLEVKMHRANIGLKNVVGVLPGAGPLAKEFVVVGAHYDHLGYGGAGGSLSGLRKMAIHHGADDNGSGTTTVLELARRFAGMPGRKGRTLVFMTFSGEELGLLGSVHYCKNPLFPLADTVAMFNLDMVGRLAADAKTGKNKLLVEGSATSKLFNQVLDDINKRHDFTLVRSPNFPPNSDHFSFYQKKIPVMFFWTGIHADYHRPSDTADKINVAGMRRVADMSVEVIDYLATVEKRPDYIQMKTTGTGGRPGSGPRLGILPAYSDEGSGVLLEGVQDGRPAAKAGMQAGDRIVELAGKPVKNLETYMEAMGTQKAGTTIDIVILRKGQKQTVKVALE